MLQAKLSVSVIIRRLLILSSVALGCLGFMLPVHSANWVSFDHDQAIPEDAFEAAWGEGMSQYQQADVAGVQILRFSHPGHSAERFVLSNSGAQALTVATSQLSLNALLQKMAYQDAEGAVLAEEYFLVGDEIEVPAATVLVLESDGDNDGMSDAWEVAYGLDETSDDSAVNSDDDGLNNRDEFLAGTSPLSLHSDTDVLGDAAELAYGTDPLQKDTDGDGFNDHCEVIDSSDPLNPASVPTSYASADDCPFEHFFNE